MRHKGSSLSRRCITSQREICQTHMSLGDIPRFSPGEIHTKAYSGPLCKLLKVPNARCIYASPAPGVMYYFLSLVLVLVDLVKDACIANCDSWGYTVMPQGLGFKWRGWMTGDHRQEGHQKMSVFSRRSLLYRVRGVKTTQSIC